MNALETHGWVIRNHRDGIGQKTYKDMLIPSFRCANGIESKCVRPKEYHWEQWTLQCAFTLSRVGINTKFDWRWTENLKIAENYGREICMGAYMSEGCQKSVSSPKTLETFKRFEAGCVPGTPVARVQSATDWATEAVDRYWERIQSIESLWLRIETGIVGEFSRPSTIAVVCHKVKIWSVQVPRTETAYWCLHERGDKGRYWPSLEGPWSKKTKGCNEISQTLHGTGNTPWYP